MKTWEESCQCEKHGEYTGKFYTISGKVNHGGNCHECTKERNKLESDEEEKKECERAHALRIKKREDAGISKRNLFKTFDDYHCSTEGQTKAKNDCVRYFNEFPSDKSMIMVGGVGTGKTLLASAGLDSIVDNNRCEMIKVIDVVRELKATWAKDSNQTEEKLIKYYANIDLLVLDEVGSQFGSDTEKLFIFDIIDGRYQNMKPTILISNLDIDGIKDAIGDRCVDRLREGGGMMVAFNWESSRK